MLRRLPILALVLLLGSTPARADERLRAGIATDAAGGRFLVVSDGATTVTVGVAADGRPVLGGRAPAGVELEPATLRFGRTSLRGLVTNERGLGFPVDEALYVLEVRSATDGSRTGIVAFAPARPEPAPADVLVVPGRHADQVVAGGEAFRRRVDAALSVAAPLAPELRIGGGSDSHRIDLGAFRVAFVPRILGAGAAVAERAAMEADRGGYGYVVSAGIGPAEVPAPRRVGPDHPAGARVEPLAPATRFTPFRVDRVWVDSPAPSGHAGNDRFPVEHYVPDGEAKAAVIVLPIWKGGLLVAERIVAGHLAARGYEAAIVPLPWQFQRAPEGVRSGSWTVSSDLERTRKALLQARADVRMVADWLRGREEVRDGRLAILGISLGAHVAAAEYQVDDRYEAAVIVMAGGDPASMVWDASRETRRMKAELVSRGVTLPELREFLAPLDPANQRPAPEFPAFPRYRGALMVNATEDEVVPPANAEILWRALGKPTIRWLPVTHYTMALRIPEVLRLADAHLDAVFE